MNSNTAPNPKLLFLATLLVLMAGLLSLIGFSFVPHDSNLWRLIFIFSAALSSFSGVYLLWGCSILSSSFKTSLSREDKLAVELQTINHQLESTIESVPCGIMMVDKTGRITLANGYVENLFGYSKEELLGSSIEMLVPQESRKAHAEMRFHYNRAPVKHVMGSGRDLVGMKKDGTLIQIEIGLNHFDIGGDPYVIASIIDISERLAVAKKLHTQAKDLARSNKELEQFAYIASHDLQEPIRMVGSFAALLNDKYKNQFDETGEKWLRFIVEGAARMRSLVQDLLKYSRAGSVEIKLSPVDPNKICKDVLTDLRQAIEESKATVAFDPLPKVLADESQIRLVFQNLIANAIKFRKDGEAPRIHVGTYSDNGKAQFIVQDSGIGIDPKYFEKLFIIFQRLHPQSVYPGTGIGLAICKKIIDRHGGDIWVESSIGQGSKFYFSLKLA